MVYMIFVLSGMGGKPVNHSEKSNRKRSLITLTNPSLVDNICYLGASI